MAKSPLQVIIRTYNVGFGDCFLLSFNYGRNKATGKNIEKHVLIDFGSTGFPEGTPKTRMMDIALDIKDRTGGKLDAVVATHRHRDHISGFATKEKGVSTGQIIKSLKPDLVVQPWTEDPKIRPNATGPAKANKFGPGASRQVAALSLMHTFAFKSLGARNLPRALNKELRYLGQDNIANPQAVDNLMAMAKNSYVYCGQKSGLEKLLPGVRVDVLGPPTLEQTSTIKKQRSKDPNEFWHFQLSGVSAFAYVDQLKAASKSKTKVGLFPEHVESAGPTFPVGARWLIYHARNTRATQLLQIVRSLDKQMNNTSLILLFRVGGKSLLFPGDAQIENWQYALGQDKYTKLLSDVDVYKVGHHGSLNATPKSLLKLLQEQKRKDGEEGLKSIMSTMEDKHGSTASHTEVPRETLVKALKRNSTLFSTQDLKVDDLSLDIPVF